MNKFFFELFLMCNIYITEICYIHHRNLLSLQMQHRNAFTLYKNRDLFSLYIKPETCFLCISNAETYSSLLSGEACFLFVEDKERPAGGGFAENLGLLVPPATHTQDCFPAAAGGLAQ